MDEMKTDVIKFKKDKNEILDLDLKHWLQKFRMGESAVLMEDVNLHMNGFAVIQPQYPDKE